MTALPKILINRSVMEVQSEALAYMEYFTKYEFPGVYNFPEKINDIVFERGQDILEGYLRKPMHIIDIETSKRVDGRLKTWESMNDVSAGINALMKHAITEAYSIVEIFSGDLWVAAVNSGPLRLKERAFNSSNNQRAALLAEFKKQNFDASISLGDMLKSSGCVSFRSLDQIDASFLLLVRQEDKRGDAKGCGILGEAEDVRLLSAIRNIIVHNNGETDERFKQQARKFTEFRDLPNGTKFGLTGDLLYRLLKCCLKSTEDLLCALNAAYDS